MSTRIPAPNMPVLSDQSSEPIVAPSLVRIRKVPMIDANTPIAAMSMGSTRRSASNGSESEFAIPSAPAPTAASAIVAMMEPV